jgi:hypothetical protein
LPIFQIVVLERIVRFVDPTLSNLESAVSGRYDFSSSFHTPGEEL